MSPAKIGYFQKQPQGFKAFIPYPFPPKEGFVFSEKINKKNDEAMRLLGKLDGITELLPNKDFFLFTTNTILLIIIYQKEIKE